MTSSMARGIRALALVHLLASVSTITLAQVRKTPRPTPIPVIGAVAASTVSLQPDCLGDHCGAVSPTQYSGTGVGIWRYSNSTGQDVSLDIDIQGIPAGKSIFTLFSNGTASAAPRAPNLSTLGPALRFTPGVLAADVEFNTSLRDAVIRAVTLRRAHDTAHDSILRKNADIARKLLRFRIDLQRLRPNARPAPPPAVAPIQTPAIGFERTWQDNFDQTPVPHQAKVTKICPLAAGRNAVFWVEPSAMPLLRIDDPAGGPSTNAIDEFARAFCGDSGGYKRLVDLMGGPWGPAALDYPGLIHDSGATLLDVNIVVLNVPDNRWGGYFASQNNYSKRTYPSSNEGLAFFASAKSIQDNLKYMVSTLIHETTHMINFYQRTIARGKTHGVWLEETTAMMSEDIVAPSIQSGKYYSNVVSDRIPGYLASGGGFSYIGWTTLSNQSYAMGGAFGAFLNRLYGPQLFSGLVTGCDDSDYLTSYSCLDKMLRDKSSNGLRLEFARFGASLFGGFGIADIPSGYGFLDATWGNYSLPGIDIAANVRVRPVPATTLEAGFPATSQTYIVDGLSPGQSGYRKVGVLVPAGTDLIVVVRQARSTPCRFHGIAGAALERNEQTFLNNRYRLIPTTH